jgi:hypothetical protein
MAAKPTPVPQPCIAISVGIGQTISAIEAVARTEWSLRDSCLEVLQQHLSNLQNEYSSNCSGGKSKSKP